MKVKEPTNKTIDLLVTSVSAPCHILFNKSGLMDRRNAARGICFCSSSPFFEHSQANRTSPRPVFAFTSFTRHCSNFGAGRYPVSTWKRANSALILHRSDLQLARTLLDKHTHLLHCSQKRLADMFSLVTYVCVLVLAT